MQVFFYYKGVILRIMEITKLIQNITPYFKYENESGATTQDQFQIFLKNLHSGVKQLTVSIWQPQTQYSVGKIINSPNMPDGMEAVVTTGGTSGTTEPVWTTSASAYNDNTVKWQLRYKRFDKYIATQVEAETGADNTKAMTPLRTKNAIDKNCPIKTFNTIESLGLDKQTVTWQMIYSKLPSSSELLVSLNSTDAPLLDMPYNGWVRFEVVKISSGYAVVYGYYWGTEITHIAFFDENEFRGWKQLSTTDYSPTIYQRNGYYRGKNLGTLASVADVDAFVTAHEITSGKYTDLFVGDEIKIQDGTYNATWLIAGIDWDYNKGDTASGRGIMLIPKAPLYNDVMNDTNTTEGGYKGSKMFTTNIPALVTKLQAVLGSHLKKRRVLLSNAINTSISCGGLGSWTGASSSWEWIDVYAVLPSENEVYGSPIWSSSGYDAGEANQKLPIFNFINPAQFSRWYFWLRSVAVSTYFCFVDYSGYAYYHGASSSFGVRPLIYLG